MKISIIGSGNVATVLGILFKQKNFLIDEVVSRNKAHALNLAEKLNATAIDNISAISKESDVYIIAVSDAVVNAVGNQLNLDKKIIAHTCGSASINILKNASNNFGVLYPLQSLRKEISHLPVIPFLIDANNQETKETLLQLANAISNNVTVANDEERMQYHLAAVIASNFTNHLFALSNEYCEKNHLQFSVLFPLIEEVVNRLKEFKPAEMQTGPAIRGDVSTIKKHLALLNNFPQLKSIYKMISKSILAAHKITPNK